MAQYSINPNKKRGRLFFKDSLLSCNNPIPLKSIYNIPTAALINNANIAPALSAMVFNTNALVLILFQIKGQKI